MLKSSLLYHQTRQVAVGILALTLLIVGSFVMPLHGVEAVDQVSDNIKKERNDWRLAEGQFYPAVMPMVLVFPRPDNETAPHARQRWAHPEVLYRMPAAVIQGGAWPFYYEIIEAPTGASIGAHPHSGMEYGVLSWTPKATDEGKTFTFVVRVTDQEQKALEARWAVTVDADKFLFLAPNGSSDNPGTIDKPMRDVADFYRGDAADASYADRLVYFRGGEYVPVGLEKNKNIRIEKDKKPMTYMAFPDENAVLDATHASWTFWADITDVYFSGLQFKGSKTKNIDGSDVKNSRNICFYGESNQKRVTFFEVKADGIQPGSLGNDNPAFVWRPSTRKRRGQFWAFVGNEFSNGGPKAGNGPCAVSISCVSHIVFERNTVVNWDGTGTLYDKANDDYITYRNNNLWNVSSESGQPSRALGAGLSGSYDRSHKPGYVEVCWNRIRVHTGNPKRNFAISAAIGAVKNPREPVWVYRNSIIGTIDFVGSQNFTAVFDKNVVQGRANRSAKSIIEAGDNLWIEDNEQSVFDEDGGLHENYRQDHLGIRGAELHNGDSGVER